MQVQKKDFLSLGSLIEEVIEFTGEPRLIGVQLDERMLADIAPITGPQDGWSDMVQIVLEHPGGASIPLKSGLLGIGRSLIWMGDLPIRHPMRIRAIFNSPAVDFTCSVSWLSAERGEDIRGNSAAEKVVQTYPIGQPTIIKLDGVADSDTVDVSPAAGRQWLLYALWGYHNDGTSRAMKWHVTSYPFTDAIDFDWSASLAANAVHYFSFRLTEGTSAPSIALPTIFTSARYPQITIQALTAGKQVFVRGYALEFGEGL